MSSRAHDNPPATQTQSGSPFNQSKFVPDISMIVDFSYVSRNLDNDRFSALSLPGLSAPLEINQGNDGSNAHRGFNLNYGEMTLYSIVDPYFDLFAVLHMVPEHAGLEEAYITTRKLPYGFQVKAGKFLSGIGRMNEQHEHTWDFVDRPLISQAFFGEEGLNEIGARITWVAPTDIFLMLGTEILTGDNEVSFGTTGFSDPNGTVNVHNSEGPSLLVGYARSSFDIDEAALLFGLSYAHGTTKADQGFSVTEGEGLAIDATTDILCGDMTVKYVLDPIRYISFQSEYLYRVMDGKFFVRDSTNVVLTNELTKHQAGFYAQLITKLGLQWRIGVRYNLLNLNDVNLGNVNQSVPKNLARYSAMIEYNPTEFSRLRLQYSYDRSKYIHPLSHTPYSEIILQFNVAIGAHGAHSF
jgi:outer membrane receptor protein involved in Fe transport